MLLWLCYTLFIHTSIISEKDFILNWVLEIKKNEYGT